MPASAPAWPSEIPSAVRISGSHEIVLKNAIDCRPMRPAIDHATGSRHSGAPTGAGTGSCARTASGSQTAAATTPTSPQIASAGSQPPKASANGIAVKVAIVAPATSEVENAPVSTPTPSVAFARTHAGVTTWVSAIAAPASSVPRYSAGAPPIPRAAVPAAVTRQAASSTRSTGYRRAIRGPSGARMPRHSSGPVVSRPAAAALRCRSARTSASSGGRLPNSGRRLSPVRTTGTASALTEEDRSGFVEPGVDQLRLGERLGQRDALDPRAAQRDHRAVVALGDGVHGLDAEAAPEHAVEGQRRAAALDVAEDRRARLEPRALLDLLLEDDPDAAEAHMAERVGAPMLGQQPAVLGRRALGDDDDRERRAARMAALEVVAHVVDVERPLRDEDHVGAAGDPGVDREPAGVAAHDLAHEHAVVRLGGGVQAIDRVGGDLHRGLKAEREVRGREVVVDRLGHADDRDPVLVQLAGDAERVLATDRDQRVQVAGLERGLDLVQAVLDLVDVGAGRPEDRPAAMQDPARAVEREVTRLVVQYAGPAVAEADELVPVGIDALADDGPDDRIEPGAVAAAGEHADSHGAQIKRARPPASSRAGARAASSAGAGGTSCAPPAASSPRAAARRARASRRAGSPRRGRRPSA